MNSTNQLMASIELNEEIDSDNATTVDPSNVSQTQSKTQSNHGVTLELADIGGENVASQSSNHDNDDIQVDDLVDNVVSELAKQPTETYRPHAETGDSDTLAIAGCDDTLDGSTRIKLASTVDRPLSTRQQPPTKSDIRSGSTVQNTYLSSQKATKSSTTKPLRNRTLKEAFEATATAMSSPIMTQQTGASVIDTMPSLRVQTSENEVALDQLSLREINAVPVPLLVIELDRRRSKVKLLIEFIWFLVYFALYLSVLELQRDVMSCHHLQKGLVNGLIDQSTFDSDGHEFAFEDISTIPQIWTWLNNVFAPKIMATHWYNNDTLPDRLRHTVNHQSRLVGGFRIGQSRGKTNAGPYCYKSPFDSLTSVCKSNKEETSDIPCDGRSDCALVSSSIAFQHRTDSDGHSGYFQEFYFNSNNFTISLADSIAKLDELYRLRFFDEHTRSVWIHASFYNSNRKRWISTEFMINIAVTGKFSSEHSIDAVRVEMYNWNSGRDILRSIIELLYLCLAVSFLVRESYRAYYHRFQLLTYLRYNYMGWLAICVNLTQILLYLIYLDLPQRESLLNGQTSYTEFVDLETVKKWDTYYLECNTVSLLFMTLWGVRFFQVTSAGEAVFIALSNALPIAISYFPMYAMALSGFALAGMFLFGFDAEEWSTFAKAFYTVFEINFGVYDMSPVYTDATSIGRIYLFLVLVVFVIVLLNIFLAIVINAWDDFASVSSALAKLQSFGIEQVSVWQTAQSLFYRLPLVEVRNAISLGGGDVIVPIEFIEYCNDLSITEAHRNLLIKWLWNDYYHTVIVTDDDVDDDANDDGSMAGVGDAGTTLNRLKKFDVTVQTPRQTPRKLPRKNTKRSSFDRQNRSTVDINQSTRSIATSLDNPSSALHDPSTLEYLQSLHN